MKSLINKKVVILACLICFFSRSTYAGGVQVDPALAGAITLQMNTLKKIYSKREKNSKQNYTSRSSCNLSIR